MDDKLATDKNSFDKNSDSTTIKEKIQDEAVVPDRPKDFLGCRHTFALMGFLGLTCIYLTRTNLTVAIVDMINSTSSTTAPSSMEFLFRTSMLISETSSSAYANGTCPYDDESGAANQDGEFNWNAQEKGLVLGAFYWGFLVTQIPGGILAERFGGKWVFGLAVVFTDLFCLLSPIAARSGGLPALIVVRILNGLAEGVTWPAITSMISKWIPNTERTTIGSFVMSGIQFGAVISYPLAAWLCTFTYDNGWPLAFYVPGSIGLVWFVGWVFLVYDNPSVHPRIAEDEKLYIQALSNKSTYRSMKTIPWLSIMTSVRMWAIIAAHFGSQWGFLMILTELPSYMKGVLHFDLKTNGLLTALPYLCAWVFSIGFSTSADFLKRRQIFSNTIIRKIYTTIGHLLPACALVGATYTGCDRVGTLALICLASAFSTANYSGFMSNHIDIASNFGGTLMGITNTFANTCGVIVPAVVGAIVTDEESLSQWRIIFFVSAGIYLAANLFYVLFATAEEQPWNRITVDPGNSSLPSQERNNTNEDADPIHSVFNPAFIKDDYEKSSVKEHDEGNVHI